MKVFVVAMSAPAAKYASWISATTVGLREVQEVGVALHVVRVAPEALSAVLLLREPSPVDEDAPGPVEHEDPLGEEGFELCADVCHEIGSRLERSEPEAREAL